MFESLNEKLEGAFKSLKGEGKLTELNIATSIKEIRRALVAADVNYKIAKEFTDKVMDYVLSLYPESRLYQFTEEDLAIIRKLRDEKYATHEWNFGKSPDYTFKKAIRTQGGLLEMNIEAKKGVIEDVKIFGDFFSERGIDEIEQALVGVQHEENAIREVLGRFDISKYFSNITVDNLIEAMF